MPVFSRRAQHAPLGPDATSPHADIAAEAERLIATAEPLDLPLRLIGGLAVKLHCSREIASLERQPQDIDLVTLRGKGKAVTEILPELGYVANLNFNTMNSGKRALFYDTPNERQVDVFVGSFEMCHAIPMSDRILLEDRTLPLAELLLTKLQIYELNDKDQRDILRLLVEHDVAESDHEQINAAQIAALCAADWGLWRTCKLNVERTLAAAGEYDLDAESQAAVRERLGRLWDRIEAEPKPKQWRMRNRIGDHRRWYQQPDEVG
jgi:hypothetical protein